MAVGVEELKGRAKGPGAEREKKARGEAQGAAPGRERSTAAPGAGHCGARQKPLLSPAHLSVQTAGCRRPAGPARPGPSRRGRPAFALSTSGRTSAPHPRVAEPDARLARQVLGCNHNPHSSWGASGGDTVARSLSLYHTFVALAASSKPEHPLGPGHG